MKSPILTKIYRVFAALAFIASAFCLFAGLADQKNLAPGLIYAAALLVSGVISLGIAEVVFLIAKIEFNTRESSQGYQMLKSLQTIAKNTAQRQNAE
jgi:hypothetical protein